MRTLSYFLAMQLAVLVAALPARAQAPSGSPVLSLADALNEADRRAFSNRIASAANDTERARARLPLKGILPSVRVEGGLVQTTDPIGAFGTTLRQRLVTPAAFDPARLNRPPAVTNATGALVVELPLLNGDAWLGLRAARAAADATELAGEWSARQVRADVVRAYFGAILAADQVRLLEGSRLAAVEGARQVRALVDRGLVTKSDALQAAVRANDVSSQLLSAEQDALAARERLALLLGRGAGEAPQLPSALPDDATVLAMATRDTAQANSRANALSETQVFRDDVGAARAGVQAAEADRRRAASTLLPRVNGFARYDWNNPNALFAGQKNWTMGVMASWSIFGGNAELADNALTGARVRSARAQLDAAVAQSRLERDDAARRLTLAVRRLALANDAAEQSREAHRLVQKRYDGGLVSMAELLSADATAMSSALAHSAARYAVIDAMASWRRAIGDDPSALSVLDTPAARAR